MSLKDRIESKKIIPDSLLNIGKKGKAICSLIPAGVVCAMVATSLSGYQPAEYEAKSPEPILVNLPEAAATAKTASAIELPKAEAATEAASATATTGGSKTGASKTLAASDDSSQKYKDGTYTGSATGWGGPIEVEVTIKNGKIHSIKVLSAPNETPQYLSKAKGVTARITAKQTTNVDAVSGATYSSNGIIKAVRNALLKARVNGSKYLKSASTASDSTPAHKTASKKKSGSQKTTIPRIPKNATLKDGTYEGSGDGWGGKITVSITIKNKKLTDIKILSASEETGEFLEKAKGILPSIIKAQNTDVDVISGATYSSNGILSAVADAMSKAMVTSSGSSKNTSSGTKKQNTSNKNRKSSGNNNGTDKTGKTGNKSGSQTTKTQTVSADGRKDGTYTGTGEGWGGDVKVSVTIKNEKITKITILSATDETDEFFARAKGVIPLIIKAQNTDVDVVSGATYSSNGILSAVADALAKASPTGSGTNGKQGTNSGTKPSGNDGSKSSGKDTTKSDSGKAGTNTDKKKDESDKQSTDQTPSVSSTAYKDGTYTGTGNGWGGDIDVSVTIVGGKITGVDILYADDETSKYLFKAKKLLPSIISKQTSDVDVIAGATYSSNGIKEAVKNALAKAVSTSGGSEQTASEGQKTDSGKEGSTSSKTDDSSSSGKETDDSVASREYKDGTYAVTAEVTPDRFKSFDPYDLSMKITVSGGTITALSDFDWPEDEDNDFYMDFALNGTTRRGTFYPGIPAQIKEKGLPEGIDTVAGATCSSNAILAAAKKALDQAAK